MKSSFDQRDSQFVSRAATDACCDRRQKSTIGLRMIHQGTPGLAKQTKSGYLLRYKKRIFGKDWREDYVVLYGDSTLTWYRDRERLEPDGGICVKSAPHMMAVGQWTSLIPFRPSLPNGCQVSCLMAFGNKKKDKVHWFLCKDDDEVSGWMTAICKTLPPPPRPLKAASADTQSSVTARELKLASSSSSSIAINSARTPLSLPPRYLYGSYLNSTARLLHTTLRHRPHCALPPRPVSMLQIPQFSNNNNKNQQQQQRGEQDGLVGDDYLPRGRTPLGTGWGWGHHWGEGVGAGWGWGCGWGCYDRGFHYSDTDIRINRCYDGRNRPRGGCCNHDGYADSTTAMQVAYHNEIVNADLMDDDFVGDSDNFDVGGFDCIF